MNNNLEDIIIEKLITLKIHWNFTHNILNWPNKSVIFMKIKVVQNRMFWEGSLFERNLF